MSEVTRGDAELVLKLYDMRREATMRKARSFMIGQFYAANGREFAAQYPPGTEESAWFRQTTTYWEMVAVFVKRGLLDAELLFETTTEFHIIWEKARATILDLRKDRNNPFMLKNLEDLAARHKEFMETRAPGSSAIYASMNKPPASTGA